ncbi:MAG TPA: HAMP domain-containing sensor histidine kinase [Conexibacter sp.]|nr:HAMP domain-containing sensor histidine kinase [Conexibacter sp.]
MRSLRNRLAFLFFATTLAAIAVLYLYVVPQLQSRLRDEKLSQLTTAAKQTIAQLEPTVGTRMPLHAVRQAVGAVGDGANARITLLRVGYAGGEPQTSTIADSSDATIQALSLPAAEDAVRSGRIARGSEVTSDGPVAEVALPLRHRGQLDAVAVYSTPMTDVERNVAIIRQQILIAGAISLALAVLAGWLIARALAQRVKRLERAAEQVAAGDFSRPIPVDSDDELGQLAVAFNDMQRQLAQLDRARKQFIATASHELRTPLFSLGGFVELLEDEELDEETRHRFLAQVRQQVERLAKLSVDLLDLSRLEAGSLDLRPEPVDLAELARSVSSEFEPVLAQHDSRLEMRLPSRPVEAQCDPVRVAQIVRILIDNALTHTSAGTGIVVSARRDNGFASLAVRDHGTGIERAALSQIFEPFYTSDDAQGSGLGLAIASELAERMNGRLGVESRPGRTVFTLELPG